MVCMHGVCRPSEGDRAPRGWQHRGHPGRCRADFHARHPWPKRCWCAPACPPLPFHRQSTGRDVRRFTVALHASHMPVRASQQRCSYCTLRVSGALSGSALCPGRTSTPYCIRSTSRDELVACLQMWTPGMWCVLAGMYVGLPRCLPVHRVSCSYTLLCNMCTCREEYIAGRVGWAGGGAACRGPDCHRWLPDFCRATPPPVRLRPTGRHLPGCAPRLPACMAPCRYGDVSGWASSDVHACAACISAQWGCVQARAR